MVEDAAGNIAKWLLQHRWTGPPMLMQGGTHSENRGRGPRHPGHRPPANGVDVRTRLAAHGTMLVL